uniref:Uncharacterized protein n=1 Tax=Triticum urartu TaxID=4572 RepID=A0A8R7USI7_TRIUA
MRRAYKYKQAATEDTNSRYLDLKIGHFGMKNEKFNQREHKLSLIIVLVVFNAFLPS